MKDILFFKEFLKNWRAVGSVTPSSKYLVAKMIKPIDFKKTLTVIELGAGSGPVTVEILKKMNGDSRLIVFETNLDFYKDLKKINDNRISVYNNSAVLLKEYLKDELVDYIVSGIPLANLSVADKKNLLNSSFKSLKPGGKYIQFQYSLESKKHLEKVFDKVSVDFTPLNIPPAFVFSCLKK